MYLFKKVLILGIRGYKRWISGLLPSACRFYPTCSSYALDCLKQHSLGKALYLMLARLARCHPFHPGGHDPVPRPLDPKVGSFESLKV
ncbi:MAG TPA: membrane protein insertion efficiency factor YidD [Deltaproteobacteria bacterium]|nr:membrane protein insertion efficiency factor YidD [Deltaproteobacteria bacterium]